MISGDIIATALVSIATIFKIKFQTPEGILAFFKCMRMIHVNIRMRMRMHGDHISQTNKTKYSITCMEDLGLSMANNKKKMARILYTHISQRKNTERKK